MRLGRSTTLLRIVMVLSRTGSGSLWGAGDDEKECGLAAGADGRVGVRDGNGMGWAWDDRFKFKFGVYITLCDMMVGRTSLVVEWIPGPIDEIEIISGECECEVGSLREGLHCSSLPSISVGLGTLLKLLVMAS
jgi:hypothetical protein